VAPISCQTESEETLLVVFHKTPSICGAPSFSDDDSAPRTSFQCDPNHVFLPTLQRGPQGTAGRVARAYCLLYNVIFAFFEKDLPKVAGLSVAEISQNLCRHDEEQAPPLSQLQREPGRNTSLDGELVSPSGLFVNSREGQDFIVHREVSSFYSQSPLTSPVVSPVNDVERIRSITRKFASSNDVAFIKLETIETKIKHVNIPDKLPPLSQSRMSYSTQQSSLGESAAMNDNVDDKMMRFPSPLPVDISPVPTEVESYHKLETAPRRS